MMRCQRCGAVNEEGDQFCGRCGSLLTGTSPASFYTPGEANTFQHPGQQPGSADWQAPTVAVPRPITPTQPGGSGGWVAGTWTQPPSSRYGSPSVPTNGAAAAPQPAKRRRRRWPLNLLLFVLIVALLAAGSWVFLLRPAVHQSVDGEIRQGLQSAVGQIPLGVAQAAQANVRFPIAEDQINTYLGEHTAALAPITNMNVSLQPGVMVITFQAYGFGSTVRLGLQAEGGKLVANNVEVSGLLWWVESAAELTPRLNDALSQASNNLGRPISSVSIDEGVMNLVFA